MRKILIYLHTIHLLKSCVCFDHCPAYLQEVYVVVVRGLLEKYPTFGREKETGLLGSLDT
jgi:hypothetical protein